MRGVRIEGIVDKREKGGKQERKKKRVRVGDCHQI